LACIARFDGDEPWYCLTIWGMVVLRQILDEDTLAIKCFVEFMNGSLDGFSLAVPGSTNQQHHPGRPGFGRGDTSRPSSEPREKVCLEDGFTWTSATCIEHTSDATASVACPVE
jgi:hypothetical protein